MNEYDHLRVRQAVQFLVDSPYFSQHVKKLRSVVKRPRALPFKDDAEPLNELLLVGRRDVQSLENLLAVAEFKRTDRNEYQRQFMAAKRARQRKIIQLEGLFAGRTLTAEARQKLLIRQTALWEKEKGQYLNRRWADHKADTGQDSTWMERNAFAKDFWVIKDQEIAGLLEEATKTLDKTVHRKRTVIVERPVKPTAMAEAFKNYLASRR